MKGIPLEGASVAITGAARGIGRATAAEFIRAGAQVAIGDIDKDAVKETAAALGESCIGLELDVASRRSFGTFLRQTSEALGPPDVLVNNAGVMPAGRFLEEEDGVTRTTLAVNLWGPINGIKLIAPAMVGRGSGHIVNVASLMGKFPLPGLATYTATKHAVVGLSAAVGAELEGTGVTVTAVLPSAVETDLISGIRLPAVLPAVSPEQVGHAVVSSCRSRPPEIAVPAWAGLAESASGLLPRPLIGLVRRLAGHDRALHADLAERAAYERRARDPGARG